VLVPWGGDMSEYEGAVIRGAWDYILDRGAFLDWAKTVPKLANSFEVLRWNTDKRYLRELEASGIPVVPTRWSDVPGWSLPEGEFVVKPAVSAGGRNSARYGGRADWDVAAAHVAALEASGDVAMIQPFVPSVDTVGETGTYVFGGVVSHAIRKGGVLTPGEPASSDLNMGSVDTVTGQPVDPSLAAFAQNVLAAAAGLAGMAGPCVYARVDTVVADDGSPLLMELEVAEPFLFLARTEDPPAAADRFAAAVQQWLAT
jgi:glutathione synthase/RimK-type ligase-like ATP-grasp enzyme